MTPPRLAIVSTGIRRDLLAPLKHFTKFEIGHFYRRAEYGDLTPDDLDATLHSYRSPLDLYRQLVYAHPNVIQGVEPFSLALQAYLWACYLAARKTGARLFAVTLENRPLDIKFGRTPAFLLRRVLHRYFDRTCLVIVLNEGAGNNVVTCGVPRTRIQNLMWGTWGVDLDEFAPHERRAQQPPTILFAGRLHEEKGIFVLMEAFARLSSTLPEARLIVAGDGPARREVEWIARAMSGVTMLGTVKNRMMPGIICDADVLAMPSLTTHGWEEQVGMVALQAMACGVPVVASRSGAIPEYMPDGIAGMLVPEHDATALADALIRILSDAELRVRLGHDGRAYACSHYDAGKNISFAESVVEKHCVESRV